MRALSLSFVTDDEAAAHSTVTVNKPLRITSMNAECIRQLTFNKNHLSVTHTTCQMATHTPINQLPARAAFSIHLTSTISVFYTPFRCDTAVPHELSPVLKWTGSSGRDPSPHADMRDCDPSISIVELGSRASSLPCLMQTVSLPALFNKRRSF